MKYLEFYKKKGIKEEDVFDYLIKNLKSSVKIWEYFVNWKKVKASVNIFKVELNILNSLIGSSNLEKEFVDLVVKYPNVVRVLPVLLAVRESKLEVLRDYQKGDLGYLNFDFNNTTKLSEKDAKLYYNFIIESGLINLFKDKTIKNFVDYVFGVEVGLDSNGRKNRGGTLMENIVEVFIKKLVDSHDELAYMSQATPTKIKNLWDYDVKFNKSARSFDFAIYHIKKKKLFLLETNFYNGGGSKLKSVCGEFRSLHLELSKQGLDLIWITDGLGWQSTKRPLEETFESNDYVFNLNMLQEGVLDEVVL